MKEPYLSVIIPSYNRRDRLETCLNALMLQTLNPDAYEVIVVNDGSTDDTKKYLNKLKKQWSQLMVIHQENTGQGLARNKAINKAKGQVLLFIGDDIYGNENFLECHVQFHQDNPDNKFACLGLTKWFPTHEITRFMIWLESKHGPQFSYNELTPSQELSFWYFYTSNISLKKDLIAGNKFSAKFKAYGWEDIEFAYRLEKEAGMKIIFTPEALGYHDDPMEINTLKARMLQIGKNAIIFEKMHPGVQVVPNGLKKWTLILISALPFRILARVLKKEWYWYLLSKRYFLEGLKYV